MALWRCGVVTVLARVCRYYSHLVADFWIPWLCFVLLRVGTCSVVYVEGVPVFSIS